MSCPRALLVVGLSACATQNGATPAAAASGPVVATAPAAARPGQRYAAAPAAPPRDPGRRAKAAELAPKLDKLFADEIAAHDYPGLGVAIVLDGEPVYVKGFGFRDLAAKAPFDADTVFRIASVTKSFAAMAILKLRDEGRLSLDAPAAQYFPPLAELAYPTRDSPPITLRQLLGHGSGLPEDNFFVDVSIDMNEADFGALVRSGLSFSRAPDTHFEYSNIGFGIIGQIIAAVAGMPARQYIRKEIMVPLGMTASGWEPDEIARDHLAVGYWGADGYLGRDKQKLRAPMQKDGAFDIAGGLYTTLGDMARYMAFHLSAWPPRDDPETGPVRRSTVREMQQGSRRGDLGDFSLLAREPPAVARATEDEFELFSFSYGNGFFTATTCADDFSLEHSGGLPGYTTLMTLLPERGFGVILFVNDVRVASRPDLAAIALFRAAGLLDKRAVTAVPALGAARLTVDHLLREWSADEATRLLEPTFFVYEPVAKLGDDFAKLAADHGRCQPAPLEAVNLLRGRWRVSCERGSIRFAAALSPKAEPRLQFLTWQSELPPSPRMSKVAAALLRQATSWDAAAAKALFASTVDRNHDALARLALDGGKCSLGAAIDGDGADKAVFALTCAKRPLRLDVTLDEKSGKVTAWRAYRPRAADSPNCAR